MCSSDLKKSETRSKSRRAFKKVKVTLKEKKGGVHDDDNDDVEIKPPHMFKYRDKFEAGHDSDDGDSNSDEENSDDEGDVDRNFELGQLDDDEGSRPRPRLASDNDHDGEDSTTESEGSERWYSPGVSPTQARSPPNESYDDCFTYAEIGRASCRERV